VESMAVSDDGSGSDDGQKVRNWAYLSTEKVKNSDEKI